ncbi:hypothetical protein MB46_18535 [Arthrobacter alpinus]|uniref:DUF4232 domain-containing protein n=1 Tax=Arthrobacter alpinus TaxID=656366 RepID=UPI0005C971D7|nr:DUF4232 domain-containing protein [Arthrobacter alpinus]ALV47190.1 hypothetical protein MB46_18535 [Arthrobacter alpinus]
MTTDQRTPTKRLHTGKFLTLAALIGLGTVLAACGAQDLPLAAETTSSPATTQASPSATATASPTEATPSSAPTTAPTTAPATPLCTAASLTGALDDTGGGAAGSIYMSLVLTNGSKASCILDGYPGVSLVQAGTIEPIGAPAERDAQAPSNGPITLAPGEHATATFRYTQAGNYQDCQHVDTDAVLVYPPSATDSLEIPHSMTACSNADIKLLTIGAFQP